MLVAFDFDGTLADAEMTVLLGRRAGVADEIERITERAMNDEIDYATSLRERVRRLAGLPESEVEAAFGEVDLRPGAADLLASLGEAGDRATILTGGFERGVRAALDRAGVEVDVLVANRLVVEDGELTGEVEGPLIEGPKDDALARLAEGERTVAVGDGANDLPMLRAADLAVGFGPTPAVEPACDVVVGRMDCLAAALSAVRTVWKE